MSEPDLADERSRFRTVRTRALKAPEALAREILSEIVRKDLRPGDRLPLENEMVLHYRMARSTVREALRILEVNGLVAIRSGPKGGPTVSRADPTDFGRMMSLFLRSERITLGEVLQTRRFLEPALIRDAALRQDPDFIARVRNLRERSRNTDVHDEQAYTKITREFHELMVHAGSDRILRFFGLGLMSMFTVPNRGAVFAVPQRAEVIAEHDAILDAILDKDASRAEKLMIDHMNHYCDSVLSRQRQAYEAPIEFI